MEFLADGEMTNHCTLACDTNLKVKARSEEFLWIGIIKAYLGKHT